MCPAAAYREPVQAVVGFGPPPIHDRKIEAAVQNDLLATGSGSFQRTAGGIQPDIDALHKVAPDIDVVILDKDYLFRELSIPNELGNLLQYALAGIVPRMGLTRKNELDG